MVLALYGSIKRKKDLCNQYPAYSSQGENSGVHCNLTAQYHKESSKSKVVVMDKIGTKKDDISSFERTLEESLKLITTRMDLIEYKINHLNK